MPRLTATAEATPGQKVQIVVSEALDLMNAMYFTAIIPDSEGIDGWPEETRRRLAPDLLAELGFLYHFPKGQPGVMGALGDSLFAQPQTWRGVDALLDYARNLPLGMGQPAAPGVQRLAFYSVCVEFGNAGGANEPGSDPRRQIAEDLASSGFEGDIGEALAVYDDPEALRLRMVNLIQRFYNEHYKADLPRRLPALHRSAEAHASEVGGDPIELTRRLAGRAQACLETVCLGPYDRLVFSPSMDMGPYLSCAADGPVHGLFYPCEPRFISEDAEDPDDTQRTAQLYKALGDPHRLHIVHLLRDREMYAQEIVESTGLHQSVISRHLMFMKAVGLLNSRRQNNMKFYSLNPAVRDMLSRTMDLFAGASD